MIDRRYHRRTFLKSSAALSALSFCPAGLAGPSPGIITGTPRPKKPATLRGAFFYPPADVVLAGKNEDHWSRHKWFTWPGNQFQPGEQQARFMKQVNRMCEGLDVKPAIDDKPIYTNDGIQAFIRELETSKPDALLLFNFWNSFSKKIQPILDAYQGPIIIYHPVGANHQLPPANLENAERTYYIHSIENWAALERGLRSVHAYHRVAQSRLLRVSGQAREERKDTEPFFGSTIVTVPASQYNDLYDETKLTPEFEAAARTIRKDAREVLDLQTEAFSGAVQAHAAVLELMKRHEADAVTIECLFLKHRKPCLSFSLNNGALVPCGCENDLNASMSLMLGAGLFGRSGFQHNPEFDTEENLYFASHCTCATRLHGPQKKESPYLLRPFFHQLPKTLALDVQWPEGEQATLFKYHSSKNLVNAWSGDILGSPTSPPTGGCATRVLVKMHNVEDVKTVYPGSHPILYCGNFTRQVKTFSRLYGVQVVGNV